MERLKPLGRRDIFGILLPGTIPVFTGVYFLWGIFILLDEEILDFLSQEFLSTVVLFVAAYLMGNLLRLFAADDVDKKSSEYLLRKWRKDNKEKIHQDLEIGYRKKMELLSKGKSIENAKLLFDQWLWISDIFPYAAWQNRFWTTNGFSNVFKYYKKKHKNSLWTEQNSSPKSFFNYCKLVVINGGGLLAEEINIAEGLTRFFAGTYSAFRYSIVVLIISFIIHAIFNIGIAIGFITQVDSGLSIIHLTISFGLVLIMWWMQKIIVERFRHIRLKETEAVFQAFYLNQNMSIEQDNKKAT